MILCNAAIKSSAVASNKLLLLSCLEWYLGGKESESGVDKTYWTWFAKHSIFIRVFAAFYVELRYSNNRKIVM